MNKTEDLIKAGQIAKEAHRVAKELSRPGVSEMEIENAVREVIESAGARPAFLGYKGYPCASCICVNDKVVHAIPGDYILEEGDIITIDLGVDYNGSIVDTARTHAIGKVNESLLNLISVTDRALKAGIAQAKVSSRVGDISSAIEEVINKGGIYVIKELTGHGVGKTLQEPPSIPNYGKAGKGVILEEGMVLAIEPITSLKSAKIGVTEDGWTIITTNGTPAAQIEDTVLLTKEGPVVLT